jgi:hypothetical protein
MTTSSTLQAVAVLALLVLNHWRGVRIDRETLRDWTAPYVAR